MRDDVTEIALAHSLSQALRSLLDNRELLGTGDILGYKFCKNAFIFSSQKLVVAVQT